MLSIQLKPIQYADDDEIEMYYRVESAMVENGDLQMSRASLYNEIDGHHCLHQLKTKEHFHIITMIISLMIYSIAYVQFSSTLELSVSVIKLIVLASCMLIISWVIYRPRLKHEKEIQNYYKSHRVKFFYNNLQ